MTLTKKQVFQISKVIIVILVLYIALKVVLVPLITSEAFANFTGSLGIFGYLIVMGYVVISHVFAPLAGTPGFLLGISLYGLEVATVLLYVASLISATINYYISKKFGRTWVTKLVGKEAMADIDQFAAVEGKRVLFVSRLLGFSIFEFVSYAAGLTSLSFRDYFTITAVASAVTSLISYLVFRNIDFQSELGIMIWLGTLVVIGVIFVYLIKSYLNKHKNRAA